MIRFLQEHYHSGPHEITVQVHHLASEGYPLPNVKELKEQMQLKDFLRRLFKEERHVDNEIYRVSRAMAAGGNVRELDMICDKYNDMYIHALRSGKLIHAHYHMGGIGSITDPFNHDQSRRQMSNYESSREYERQMMMQQMAAPPMYRNQGILDPGPSQAEKSLALKKSKLAEEKKKRDDDLFYLTT